jgi:hypothetical protein
MSALLPYTGMGYNDWQGLAILSISYYFSFVLLFLYISVIFRLGIAGPEK